MITKAVPDSQEDRKNGWIIDHYDLPNGVRLDVVMMLGGEVFNQYRLIADERSYAVPEEVANVILQLVGRGQLPE